MLQGAEAIEALRREMSDAEGTAQGFRDQMVEGAVTGQVGEVHDVMIAAEEAQLTFELMLEVRNKLLEGYTEIMRMQV